MHITTHLTTEETACKCGCGYGSQKGALKTSIADAFEMVRRRVGLACSANVPVIVSSGLRCIKHNAAVGGAENSRHIYGDALDLVCPADISYKKFYAICDTVIGDRGGVGWYWPGKNIVHIDLRGERKRWRN